MKEFWQTLIVRAQELIPKRSETAELLTFYARLLGAQKQIAQANERAQRALYDRTIQDVTGQVLSKVQSLAKAVRSARTGLTV